MTKLRIATDFSLPTEAVTQTFAILAVRGAGKTYTALVVAEELSAARQQFVVIDPIGVCWGLRAAADGKGPGLPIYVLGGDHGDAPIAAESGKTVAELISRQSISAVIDLSLFRKGEQTRFMTDFAETLYRIQRDPIHLILDEADAFAPQKPQPGQQRMLGAVEDLVRRGRARGIGLTLVTQRPAVLNKDVLTQCECLLTLRMVHPRDLGAVGEWVNLHATAEEYAKFRASVPSLPRGEAWLWSPGWLQEFRRVKIRARRTFDSSATPGAGRKAAPKQLAAVDLDKLRQTLAAEIKRADDEDPKKLRARIAELERSSNAGAASAATIEAAVAKAKTQWERENNEHVRHLESTLVRVKNYLDNLMGLVVPEAIKTATKKTPAPSTPPRPAPTPRPQRQPTGDASKLGKAHRLILSALAQHGPRNKIKVAVLTGYAHNGGGFNNAISSLRREGWIEGSDPLEITDAGRDALGPIEPLPTGRALIDFWLTQLGKAPRLILERLVEAYPSSLTKEEIAGSTGYEANGGGFNNAISHLRRLELVHGRGDLRASDSLF